LVYRFGIASILLLIWCRAKRLPLRIGARDHGFLVLLGLNLFSLNYLLFYIAAETLTTGLLAVIFSTMALMNIFNGALFLRRPVELRTLVGAGLGLTGICLVFWPEVSGSGRGSATIGILLSLVATYFASLGNILSARNQAVGIKVIPANALGMLYGTLLMGAYALITGANFNFDPSFGYVSSLLYLSLFGSALAFSLYLTLVGRIGPEKAAYATVLFPIVALTLSTIFEGYQWSSLAGAGIVLVLVGNILVLTHHQRFLSIMRHLFPRFL
jgi:drug/metabolite transporter (DMT)-like permease